MSIEMPTRSEAVAIEVVGDDARLDGGGAPRAAGWALAAVVALGAVVRGWYVLGVDFPLNDGGLFFAMAQDLQANGYGLPAATSYNGIEIPFAYPPLGFYLAAVLDAVTPLSLVDVFRVLPFAYSLLTVAAFGLLARRLLSRFGAVAIVLATLAFALTPRSFIWLLMGGGVARGLGLLCALLALHEAHRLYTDGAARAPRYVLTAGALSACTVLAHPETGWFLAFSMVLLWAGYGRSRMSFLWSAAMAGLTVVLTAPWWAWVVVQHGTAPFVAANATGGNVFSGGASTWQAVLSLLRLTATSEPWFPLIGALGVLGALACMRSRLWVLPVWWTVIIALDLRAYPTFTSIPVAMLAGVAVGQVVLPLARQAWDTPLLRGVHVGSLRWGRLEWRIASVAGVSRGAVLVGGLLLAYVGVGAVAQSEGFGGETHYLASVSAEQREAMRWIGMSTPSWSRVLVTPRGPWQTDREAEWFPVLAGRPSVGTVQGSEWTGGFEAAVRAHDAGWGCGYETAECLGRWGVVYGRVFTHVYVPRSSGGQCCTTLVESLRRSPGYLLIYDGAGGSVFARTSTSTSVAAAASVDVRAGE